jgi:hypothetical protein
VSASAISQFSYLAQTFIEPLAPLETGATPGQMVQPVNSTSPASRFDILQELADAADRGDATAIETLRPFSAAPLKLEATPSQAFDPTALTNPAQKPLTLQALVEAANRGDAASLKTLRRVLDEQPQIWQKVGDIAAQVEATWIRMATRGHALAAESIRREADRLRCELRGTSAAPIEKLLVDQIIACWMQLKHAEVVAGAGGKSSLMQERFHDQRLERAQRRYFGALKTLAQIRRVPVSALQSVTSQTKPLPTAGIVSTEGELRNPSAATQEEQQSESAIAEDSPSIRLFNESETREAV